ncbi:regulator [Algoriphagus sp. H41]|uniref:Regulator n=1 Tax=Algoriphagus oliviformis TaxID=2811231 RepID=A0ABS3BZK6_9BACT|nr:two-component regulator propeller domain-containing protein [Algoriphagus oliviformis]MBN7810282.1 regulator [Algoriphagus oliviformis]
MNLRPEFVALSLVLGLFTASLFLSCKRESSEATVLSVAEKVPDEAFVQEVHEAFSIGENPEDNEVRDIFVDTDDQVWIATAGGIFVKAKGSAEWKPVLEGESRGPAYAVEQDSDGRLWLGTWDGLYSFTSGKTAKAEGLEGPISQLAVAGSVLYALGPMGIWQRKGEAWEKQSYAIARSVRDALADEKGNLWVATDAGLYLCSEDSATLFQNTEELISCYAKALAFGSEDELWVGAMGGVSVRESNKLSHNLTSKEGLPSIHVRSVSRSPEGVMWVGTEEGVVRYFPDGSHSLLFSRRWLTDDQVNQVAFDQAGDAWVATQNGVSHIRKYSMTLAEKQRHFYSELMAKHMRDPWICGVLRLEVPGDTSTWEHSDDDNDGEYTGGYLAMESFRYAVTQDPDALDKARKAFGFLRLLYEVTGTDGLFARTIVPTDWTYLHDPNRTYTERELAERLVEDPRYKPVEERWRVSADKKWLWKGDTSSDEMTGHFMSYFYFYEFAATEEDKEAIRAHVSKLMDAVIRNNYNLIDTDGKHTRWAVWSPDQLNGDPDWASEKAINSFEMLAYLKFAAAITGDEKYEKEYRRLIEEEGYLENAAQLNHKNPAWKIYFDLTMEGYLFPILLKYEQDAEIRKVYRHLADEWIGIQTEGENLINNLSYSLATGKKVNVPQTVSFLRETPLDLVDWRIDHSKREDVQLVHAPILEEMQISELPPPAIRATVRWDKNPWAAIQGNPTQVREPVFWLWPYWMARYLEMIE